MFEYDGHRIPARLVATMADRIWRINPGQRRARVEQARKRLERRFAMGEAAIVVATRDAAWV